MNLRTLFSPRPSEVDWLRARVEYLEDQLVRLRRKEEGLPEVPREARKVEPMPVELRRYIDGCGQPALKKAQMERAFQLYAKHGSWEPVVAEITEEEDES